MPTDRSGSGRLLRSVAAASVVLAVAWTWLPAAGFQFLNWDDDAVVVRNAALTAPDVARWALTTTYMEHYQPAAWLTWAALRRTFGLDPAVFHLANIAAHLLCVLLVWRLARRLIALAAPAASPRAVEAAALTAALLFGVHPLGAEPVAWISALPYPLALAPALASVLAYLAAAGRRSPGRDLTAILLYALSLAARPLVLGLPAVLAIIDGWLLKRPPGAITRRVWPFAVLAGAGAAIEAAARAAVISDTPWLFRVQSAATAPFLYLGRSLAPVDLATLDLLPAEPLIQPALAGSALAALLMISVAAWAARGRAPGASAAWFSWLVLLAPAAGLISSGLQSTAHRYAYAGGVVVAIAVAGAGARLAGTPRSRLAWPVVFVALALVVTSAAAARRALAPWSDSISLWTTVVATDPGSDVARYNLALAFDERGRHADAAAQYRDVLTLNPRHADARANLARLDAARLEREANDLAARGRLAAAADRYRQALALDPQRAHARVSLGMALATLGNGEEALPILRDAIRQGTDDPAIPAALGVLLLQAGQAREARAVLEAAIARHPADVGIAHNLARLLATADGPSATDARRALALATTVVAATNSRDARALDTLAAALAINGRVADAVAANARAVAAARAQGDEELAVQIEARGRALRHPGPR